MHNIILDLNGKPFWFFRGIKSSDNYGNPYHYLNVEKDEIGSFYTNCYSEAKAFADGGKLFRCHIRTESPLIIDATLRNGYNRYSGIEIRDVKIYPETARADLIKFADVYKKTGLDLRDILNVIKYNAVFDCIIIKNVQEGNNNIPVYVIMVVDADNIYDIEDITNCNDDFSEWTTKRVRLSDFITLDSDCIEKDGVLCQRKYNNFYVEDYLSPTSDKGFEVTRRFVFKSDFKKVKIKFSNINIYIKGVCEEMGKYHVDWNNGSEIFETINGEISITGITKEPAELNDFFFTIENAE